VAWIVEVPYARAVVLLTLNPDVRPGSALVRWSATPKILRALAKRTSRMVRVLRSYRVRAQPGHTETRE
jgi:hypothetical protein